MCNNLKQIGLALLNYEARIGCFPPGALNTDPSSAKSLHHLSEDDVDNPLTPISGTAKHIRPY